MSENALLRSRKSTMYHWFSSWDGKYDTTLQSVLHEFKKKLKTLIFKEEILQWKSLLRQMHKWQKSCSDPNSNAQRTHCPLKSVLGKNASHPPG